MMTLWRTIGREREREREGGIVESFGILRPAKRK